MRTLLIVWLLALTLDAADSPTRIVNDGHGDYLYIPAGPFEMGDNFGDGEPRERPVHVVNLDAYFIGKFEVTNGEWRKFRDDPATVIRNSGRVAGSCRRSRSPTGHKLRTMGPLFRATTAIRCLA